MFEEGHKIRVILAEIAKTQVWLINQLSQHGIATDKTEMSAILSGARRGPKADRILECSVKILDEYRDEYRDKC